MKKLIISENVERALVAVCDSALKYSGMQIADAVALIRSSIETEVEDVK